MLRKKNINIGFYFLFSIFYFLSAGTVLASQTDGTVSGYAWSSQIGWINFGTTNGNVHITDSGMTGYAWNENVGWINLNPTNSGVQNNGSGTLSGYAWSEGVGWINFSGITVSSSGVFSGTASGDNNVSFSFSCSGCSATTDWRPASVRAGGSGGGGGGTISPPSLGLTINNGSQYTNNQTVSISFSDNFTSSDRLVVSNNSDFSSAEEDYFQKSSPWSLPTGEGEKTIYARVYPKYGVPSAIASGKIILDTTPPLVKITEIKDKYKIDKQVEVKGTTESGAEIGLIAGDKQGLFLADKEGKWNVSLEKLLPGKHLLEFTPKDLAGNIGESVKVEIIIEKETAPKEEPEKPSFFEKIEEIVEPYIPEFLKPEEEEKPQEIILIPKESPKALAGKIRYLDESALERFVLAPLPNDFKMLAEKFPKLAKTFGKVGIRRFTDIGKLENAKLKLPGLTESILPAAETKNGEFISVKGIPIIALSESAKKRIPAGVVFAKASRGLVDISAVLSLGDNGKAAQTIEMVARQKLQLVVKTEKAAKRVIGYIVFKSKNRNLSADDLPKDTPVQLLAALGFVTESASTPEKGETFGSYQGEQRLVIDEFEYANDGLGVYSANIQAPAVDGTYEIITAIDYKDSSSEEIKLIAVVDPEGYIYKKTKNLETRISGAKVWLYWLNPETSQYEVWPASDYQQENPQTTDERGTYSFLTPVGKYYLKVDARGYVGYKGEMFEAREGTGIHINIEMRPGARWFGVFEWKTILLLAILALLLYNFYRSIIKKVI